jgi:hypothetical protein
MNSVIVGFANVMNLEAEDLNATRFARVGGNGGERRCSSSAKKREQE